MKYLNKLGTSVMEKLIMGLNKPGDSKTIQNNDVFMAVHVECVGQVEEGKLFSVSHNYEQNGDLMRDPEVVFIHMNGYFVPASFQQDNLGIFREDIVFKDGKIEGIRPRSQADNNVFCNMWLRNIKAQQGI